MSVWNRIEKDEVARDHHKSYPVISCHIGLIYRHMVVTERGRISLSSSPPSRSYRLFLLYLSAVISLQAHRITVERKYASIRVVCVVYFWQHVSTVNWWSSRRRDVPYLTFFPPGIERAERRIERGGKSRGTQILTVKKIRDMREMR